MGSGSSKGPSSRRGGGGGGGGQGAVGGRGSPSPPGPASPDGAQAASPPPPPPLYPLEPELELLLGEVLDQVLEGSGGGGGGGGGGGEGGREEQDEDEGNQEDALRKLSLSPRALLPSPSPPPLPRLDAGDLGWRLLQDGVGSGGGGGSGGAEGTRPQQEKQDLAQKAAIATPESSNFAKQVPPKDPDKLAKIVYDCSEEELMATIEQEYCR